MQTEQALIPSNGQPADPPKVNRVLDVPSRMVYFESLQDSTKPPQNEYAITDTLHLLRARSWVIFAVLLAGGVLGAAFTFVQIPTYQAKVTMEIQPPSDNVFGTQTAAMGGTPPESFLQTQVKTLESRTLARKVIQKLRENDKLSTYMLPDRLASWRKVLGIPAKESPTPGKPGVPLFAIKVRAFEGTQVVEILCESPDPNFSADYSNTMADEFMQLSLDSRWSSYQRTTDWLSRQLGDMKAKLETSEQELQNYSLSSGLMYANEKDNMQADKLKQLQEELSKAQSDRVGKQAVYQVTTSSPADAVPQVIDNERLSGYQTKITELRREAAELGSLYTPEHYKVIRVRAQLAEVEAAFKRERETVLTRIRNEFLAAQLRERLLSSDYRVQSQILSTQAGKAIRYDVLKREVDTNRQLYGALLQKVKEASVASALSSSNMHVLDPADPPTHPFKPSMIANILKGISAGLFLGIILVIGGDRINRSLRAPGETPYHLKVPELGVIPSGETMTLPHSEGPLRPKHAPILQLGGETAPDEKVELATWQDSNSLVAESFRNTLASILLSSNGNRPKTIVVTSASHGEGKSTTVSNLGLGLAEINQKILLIDADMRKPRLHYVFNLSNSWGLSDLLREKTSFKDSPLEALVRPTVVSGLWVLPSGPGTLSISSLLYSERMSQLLARFRAEFDTILIDTPPMLSISDARILGRLADGAILVVRAGQTTRDAALRAKERLVEDSIPVLGTILNHWDLKSKTRYGYQGYYYATPSSY